MDTFLQSPGYGVLFFIACMALTCPFVVIAAAWRRPSVYGSEPPPPRTVVDVLAAAAYEPTAVGWGSDRAAPDCAVCLEGMAPALAPAPAPPPSAWAPDVWPRPPPPPPPFAGGRLVTLRCGHIFHEACAGRWAALCPVTPDCPVCKTPMLGAPLSEVTVK